MKRMALSRRVLVLASAAIYLFLMLPLLVVFPISLSAPWGISPAVLPEIPFPTKIRTAFQEPIELGSDPELAEDDDYVKAKYEEVRASIQRGMDALARRRRLPLFG